MKKTIFAIQIFISFIFIGLLVGSAVSYGVNELLDNSSCSPFRELYMEDIVYPCIKSYFVWTLFNIIATPTIHLIDKYFTFPKVKLFDNFIKQLGKFFDRIPYIVIKIIGLCGFIAIALLFLFLFIQSVLVDLCN